MDRQTFYDYLKKRISEIENKKFSEEVNQNNVLLDREEIVVFENGKEYFKIKISKYDGLFYDGFSYNYRNGGGSSPTSIAKFCVGYETVSELISRNIVWYSEMLKNYENELSSEFRKSFENLKMFPKEGNKILTLF